MTKLNTKGKRMLSLLLMKNAGSQVLLFAFKLAMNMQKCWLCMKYEEIFIMCNCLFLLTFK